MLEQLRELHARLLALNLYYRRYRSSELTVKKEVRATRFYILLFISTFIILFLYNVLGEETVTINVQHPTQTTYEQLFLSFGSSLQCPCSQISISYRSFVTMSTTLHPICTSPFIEMTWIESIFDDGDWSNIPINEF